jgi:hypothetical protein
MAAVCAEITGIGKETGETWFSAGEWLEMYDKTKTDP